MIYIEKISTGKHTTWQTFTDQFTCTVQERQSRVFENPTQGIPKNHICLDLISTDVQQNLSGIALGKYFGTRGIDIDLLLSNGVSIENLVIELSIDVVNSLPNLKLKKLLENYIVILNDFDEGGNFYGHTNLVEFLTQRGITPKLLFFVGGCFQQHDYPSLNVFKIVFDFWLLATVFSNELFYSAVFDKNKKETLLSVLEIVPDNFCALPVLKPRAHRIRLLSELDKLQLLELCDWSLGLELESVDHVVYENFNIEKYVDTNITDIKSFLSKYTFPKLLPGEFRTLEDIQSPNTAWFNRYKYYISTETYIGDDTIIGKNTFVTEKTYKGFLIGSTPILHVDAGALDYLTELGFKCQYASSEPADICAMLQDALQKPYTVSDRIHNFDHYTNKEFLVQSAVQPLNKIASLINSIRR